MALTRKFLKALGIEEKYAMERMGHATPGMLKRVKEAKIWADILRR